MDRACGTYGREEKYIQGFCGENWGKEMILKTCIDARINIKMDLKELRCENGLIWLKMGTSDRHSFQHGIKPLVCKMRGIS